MLHICDLWVLHRPLKLWIIGHMNSKTHDCYCLKRQVSMEDSYRKAGREHEGGFCSCLIQSEIGLSSVFLTIDWLWGGLREATDI